MKKIFLVILIVSLAHENIQASGRLWLRMMRPVREEVQVRYNNLLCKRNIDEIRVRIGGDHDGKMLEALKKFKSEKLIPLYVIININSQKLSPYDVVQEIKSLKNNNIQPFVAFDGGENLKQEYMTLSRFPGTRFAVENLKQEYMTLSRCRGTRFAAMHRGDLPDKQELVLISYNPEIVKRVIRTFDQQLAELGGASISELRQK